MKKSIFKKLLLAIVIVAIVLMITLKVAGVINWEWSIVLLPVFLLILLYFLVWSMHVIAEIISE